MDKDNKQYADALAQGTMLQGGAYRYRIERALGQGSFGITYLATTRVKMSGALGEIDTTVRVAVKEFFMKDVSWREEGTVTSGSKGGLFADYKRKFSREAANLSRLQHPHIVKVLETFETNGTVYYAMEYCEGGSLNELAESCGGLPEGEVVGYARQIGEALSYMHAHKMLHLDVKPGNAMLRGDGSVALIDFGLSKQYDEDGLPESSTSVGGGTPGYAPIEQSQYREGKDFPVTMDVYALGATLFKLLTGERPPEASVVLNEGFPAGALRQRKVSEAVIAVVEKAMSPLKKDRYHSVEAMLAAFDGAEEGSADLDTDLDTETLEGTFLAWDRHERVSDKVYQYERGQECYDNKDYVEAVKWWRKSAEQGDADAQYKLGECCYYGEGVAQNYVEAEKWYCKSAERGNVPAQYKLGECYYYGRGVVQDKDEAEKWYRKAAEQGNAPAQYKLGECYYYGEGVAQDKDEAVKWWRKSVEQGNAPAQNKLGECYYYGEGVAQDKDEAVKWWRKAAAQGNFGAKRALEDLGL